MSGPRRLVFLHVGPPKTGTTYLQELLWRNRRRLAAADVTYPGSRRIDHYHAALDLRGIAFGGYDDPETVGAWERLVQRATTVRTSRSVISHELLAGADEPQIARVAGDFADHELHVVYFARDLARQLPALWQESLKNRRTRSYRRFLRRALSVDERLGTGPLRAQDAASALGRWSAAVPPDRIHVVTVPPAGAPVDTLWRRFCRVIDISPEGFDVHVARANRSLSAVDAEMLRQLNARLPPDLPWPVYERIVKERFTRRADTGSPGERLLVPTRYREAVIARADQTRSDLASAGYRIIGDLEDLVPAEASFGRVARASAEQVSLAAVDMLAVLLTEEHGEDRRQSREAARAALRWLRGVRGRR
jgi:hypothetical protein